MASAELPKSGARTLLERLGDPTVRGLERGDPAVADVLLPLVYDELKRVARSCLRRRPGMHSLEPTELVHEAYARLSGDQSREWNGRIHFLAVAARAMHHLLIDRARRRGALRRGGGWQRVTLSALASLGTENEVGIESLHDALEDLARLDERQARIVELRFFGGLTIAEAAEVLGLSTTSVENQWAFARAWLRERLCRT